MFGGFEQTKDEQAGKRWLASTGTSAVIFVIAVGIGAIILSQKVAAKKADKEIDVTFRAAPETPEATKPPPPPPPPPVARKVKRAGKPAPANVAAIPEDRP